MKLIVSLVVLFSYLMMAGTTVRGLEDELQINQAYVNKYNYELLEFLKQSYDSIDPLINGGFIVSKDGTFGLVDINGHTLLPCIYDLVQAESNGYKIEKNNTYGFADKAGNIVVPPIYQELDCNDDSIAVAYYGKDGGAGILDMNGNILIPLIYEETMPFEGRWARIAKKTTRKMNYITRQGEFLLIDDADYCSSFYGDYAFVRYNTDYYFVNQLNTVKRKVKGKLIDYLGIDDLFLIKENDMYYMYHSHSDKYDQIGDISIDEMGFQENVIGVKNSEDKWGYADKDLNIIVPCIYDSIQMFHEGRAWVKRDEIYYLIDQSNNCYYQGSLLIACPFSENVSAIKTENGWGFINHNGQFVLTPCLPSDEDMLQFQGGYCDLMWSDPYSAIYIDHSFKKIIEYDIWDLVF